MPAYCGLVQPCLPFLVVLPPSWILVNVLSFGVLFLPIWGIGTAYCVAWCTRALARESATGQ